MRIDYNSSASRRALVVGLSVGIVGSSQGTIRNLRERGQDPDLDRRLRLRDGRHHQTAAPSGDQPLHNSTNPQPHCVRKNALRTSTTQAPHTSQDRRSNRGKRPGGQAAARRGCRAGCRGSPRTRRRACRRSSSSEEGVAAVAAGLRAGATADFAPCHLAADVILRAVGVKRDIRPFEGAEQLDLVGVEPGEQPVEGGKAGGGEQPVKAGPEAPAFCAEWDRGNMPSGRRRTTTPAPGSAHTPAAGGG